MIQHLELSVWAHLPSQPYLIMQGSQCHFISTTWFPYLHCWWRWHGLWTWHFRKFSEQVQSFIKSNIIHIYFLRFAYLAWKGRVCFIIFLHVFMQARIYIIGISLIRWEDTSYRSSTVEDFELYRPQKATEIFWPSCQFSGFLFTVLFFFFFFWGWGFWISTFSLFYSVWLNINMFLFYFSMIKILTDSLAIHIPPEYNFYLC